MPHRYTVMPSHNSQTQHWRGLLCGYAVTPPSRMCVCMQACAWVRVRACMCDGRVTVQPCNSLGVARVSRLRARLTA